MNWGNKLLITFLVFGTGMGYLVYRSIKTNFELVEKDYYKSELRYQEVIDGTNRVNLLSSSVKLEQSVNGIVLELPAEMKKKILTGDIWFYCDYDEKRDKRFTLQANDDGVQLFPIGAVLPGRYTVKVTWKTEGKNYFSEKYLTIH